MKLENRAMYSHRVYIDSTGFAELLKISLIAVVGVNNEVICRSPGYFEVLLDHPDEKQAIRLAKKTWGKMN